MTYYVLKALATLVALPVTLPLFYFHYHTMRYRFDNEGIHMSWGILLRREIMLTYSRIQDIHLRSNVVGRWLGLARIEIQTASGSSSGDLTLEGIADPEAMRDFLYSRMRGAHQPPVESSPEPLAHTLQEIASELREIRTLLERARG
jgi:putative membrane protein